MTTYLITYTDGSDQQITATRIEPGDGHYVVYRDRAPVGWIPTTGVRSIVPQDATGQPDATAILEQVRNIANTWFLEGEPGPTRTAGKRILGILNTHETN